MLFDRHKEQIEHEEFLTGILASTICNFSMGAPEKPKQPSDFMPSKVSAKPEKKKRVNRKAIADQLRVFLMAQTNVRKGDK